MNFADRWSFPLLLDLFSLRPAVGMAGPSEGVKGILLGGEPGMKLPRSLRPKSPSPSSLLWPTS